MPLIRSFLIIVLTLTAACSEGDREASGDDASVSVDAGGTAASSRVAQSAADPSAGAGSLEMTVNGQEKVFTHFPSEKNLAMMSATMVLAQPEAGATERLSVVVMNFNVKSSELPATLSLGLKDAMKSDDPLSFARAPKPMLEYTDPEGVSYAGYADMTFESYENGTVSARVADVDLSPADRENAASGPVTLSGIRFSVKL